MAGQGILTALLTIGAVAQDLFITPGNGTGHYRVGEPIHWKIQVSGGDIREAKFTLKQGGLNAISNGVVQLTEGQGRVEARADEPGWLVLEATATSTGDRKVTSLGGAVVAPEKLTPALPRPSDFDAFWQAKLDELAAVPMNAQLEAVDVGKPDLEYAKVTMANIRGTRIRGQLARPKAAGKRPAMLIVQWAGVYPLHKDWVTGRANEGWLVLDISAHDLPIDEPEKFYQEQSAGALKDYPAIGNDDRESSYFLRMYLSCFRGAQYLVERPDWDGRTLVVTGGSQGGLQSFVTAALHPRISAVMANVPAGCDLSGPEAKRLPGWPMWFWKTQGKDETKVREASRYFDVVNFASRVRCPVLVGIGLIDTVCPPPGIFAACNQLQGPKEIVLMPLSEHGEKQGSQRSYYGRFDAWNRALLKGEAAPVR